MEKATLDLNDAKEAHWAERLRDDLIVWFTSVRADGRPHSFPVWFWWDGATILVYSRPGQKVRNIQQNPAVVLTVDDTKNGDDVVIIEGRAELVDDPGLSMANPPFVAKYGALMAEMHTTPEKIGAEYNQVIRVTPTRFRGF